MHLPGKITYKEIDDMIATVDKNEDWKISYSEFRVSMRMTFDPNCGMNHPSSILPHTRATFTIKSKPFESVVVEGNRVKRK